MEGSGDLAAERDEARSMQQAVRVLSVRKLHPAHFEQTGRLQPLPFRACPAREHRHDLFHRRLPGPVGIQQQDDPLRISRQQPEMPGSESHPAERHRIRNRLEIEELLRFLASSIGSPCNPAKLSNTFKSLKKIVISNKTITNYINYMRDAFMIEKAIRYNIKGKKYINTLAKYYFTDMGLRNALLDFRQIELSHIMENIIFNELLYRGYSVDVGVVEVAGHDKEGKYIRKQFEVDFVVNDADKRYYIQSALSIPNEDKMLQETASFRNIDDSFKKILVVKDDLTPYRNEEGFLIVGLFDFLINPDVIDKEL